MFRNKTPKKLELDKKRIRHLSADQLEGVAGGMMRKTPTDTQTGCGSEDTHCSMCDSCGSSCFTPC